MSTTLEGLFQTSQVYSIATASVRHFNMAQQWNPREVLDTYPGTLLFHCSGLASNGERCKMRTCFSPRLLCEASRILDNLQPPEQFENLEEQLLPVLERLAFCTLCPSWHQKAHRGRDSQINTVANAWFRILTRLVAQRARQTRANVKNRRNIPAQVPSPMSSVSENIHYPSPYPSPSSSSSSSDDSSSSNRSILTPSQSSTSSISSSSQSSVSSQGRPARPKDIQVEVNNRIDVTITPLSNTRRRRRHLPPRPSSIDSSPSTSPQYTSHTSSNHTLENEPLVVSRHIFDRLLDRNIGLEQSHIRRSDRSSDGSSSQSSSRSRREARSLAPSPSTRSNLTAPSAFVADWLSHIDSHTSHTRSSRRRGASSTVINAPSTRQPSPPASLRSTPISRPSSPPASPVQPVPAPYRVRRQPINNTSCYICYEAIARPEDAKWCRAHCGQNICLECHQNWRAQLEEEARPLECGYWYVLSFPLMTVPKFVRMSMLTKRAGANV